MLLVHSIRHDWHRQFLLFFLPTTQKIEFQLHQETGNNSVSQRMRKKEGGNWVLVFFRVKAFMNFLPSVLGTLNYIHILCVLPITFGSF